MRALQIADAVQRSGSIIDAVSEATGIGAQEIKGAGRSAKIARARHMALYVIREVTGLSFPAMGEIFKRDHSTIMHGHRMATKLLEDDQGFRDLHTTVLARLSPSVPRETIGGNDGERAS